MRISGFLFLIYFAGVIGFYLMFGVWGMVLAVALAFVLINS